MKKSKSICLHSHSSGTGLGSIQRAILRTLLASDDYCCNGGELCDHLHRTQFSGQKFATFKTAFSRAVWSLAEKNFVDVWALAWMRVNSKEPYDGGKHGWTYNDMFMWWHGSKSGKRPRVREIELANYGLDVAYELVECEGEAEPCVKRFDSPNFELLDKKKKAKP